MFCPAVFIGKLEERGHLEDVVEDCRMALKKDVYRIARVLTGFIRLRTGTIIVLL